MMPPHFDLVLRFAQLAQSVTEDAAVLRWVAGVCFTGTVGVIMLSVRRILAAIDALGKKVDAAWERIHHWNENNTKTLNDYDKRLSRLEDHQPHAKKKDAP